MGMKRIWGVKCSGCLKRLFSFHTHDYKSCDCYNETFVDGGRSYLRYGWKRLKPTRIYWSKRLDGELPKSIKSQECFPY